MDENSYLKPYLSLRNLAEKTVVDPKQVDLRALSLAVYGWMPTIMKRDDFERFQRDKPVQSTKAIVTCSQAIAFIENMNTDPVTLGA